MLEITVIVSMTCPVFMQIKEFIHNARSDFTNSYTTCKASKQSSVFRTQ